MKVSRMIVVIGAFACACADSTTPEPVGGETHFLAGCDEGACGAGLECICGVCTKPCTTDNTCKDQSPLATCEPAGTPNGACVNPQASPVCDVECNANTDCNSLGSGFTCEQGSCRKLSTGACIDQGVLYSAAAVASDPCLACRCSPDDMACNCEDAGMDAARVSLPPTNPECAPNDRDAGSTGAPGTLTPFVPPPLCDPAIDPAAMPGVELVYNGEYPRWFEVTATDLYFFRDDNMGLVRTDLSTLRSWLSGPLGSGGEGYVAVGFAVDGCDLHVANVGGYLSTVQIDGSGYRETACCIQTNSGGEHTVRFDATHLYVVQGRNLYRLPRGGTEIELFRARTGGVGTDVSLLLQPDHVLWAEETAPNDASIVAIPKDASLPANVLSTGLGRVNTLDADASHIYVGGETVGGTISRVPLTGGSPELVRNTNRVPISLRVDESHIYWLQEPNDPNGGVRTLWKAPKAPGSEATQIASNVDRFRLTNTHVYWIQSCNAQFAGAILRAPKDIL